MSIVCGGLLVMGWLSLGTVVSHAQVTLIPYGATAFRYDIVPNDCNGNYCNGGRIPFPPGEQLPGYDDSSWPLGGAPFGSNPCSGVPVVVTPWNPCSGLFVRRHFTVDGAPSGARFKIRQGNCAIIYINGSAVDYAFDIACPPVEHVSIIPDGILHSGDNLLAVSIHNVGGSSYFDIALEASTITPTIDKSWGSLKILYR